MEAQPIKVYPKKLQTNLAQITEDAVNDTTVDIPGNPVKKN
jgi:hypothetical protein